MLTAMAAAFPVFALILLGWAAGRRGVLPPNAVDALNGFVVRLALPALLFQFVAEADWRALWHPGFVVALAASTGLVFAGSFLSGVRRRPAPTRNVEALAAAYGNTAFMGIPLGQALFGTIGLAAAVIASLLTVCLLFALSILIAEVEQHRALGLGHAAARVAGSLARNPLVQAPVLGALWAVGGLALPDPLHRLLTLLGAAASPVALVTIGLFLAANPAGGGASRVLPLVGLKLLAQPLAALALVRLLGVPDPWGAAAVVMAALPTGTGPFMLARLYGQEAAVIARAILLSTLISAVTIPLLVAALR